MNYTQTKVDSKTSDIIRKVADRFTDTFNEEIEDRLMDEGLDATEQEVEAVIREIVKIYK